MKKIFGAMIAAMLVVCGCTSNATQQGRAQNRRVEIKIIPMSFNVPFLSRFIYIPHSSARASSCSSDFSLNVTIAFSIL